MWDNSQEFKELNIRVAELLGSTPDTKLGKVLSNDVSVYKKFKSDEASLAFYEQIRTMNSDIDAISNNTGISKAIIEKIKNHVFHEKHILNNGIIDQFAPCENTVAAWKWLIAGEFTQSDLRLLQHELAESLLMRGQEISWNGAHPTANLEYNWYDNL